MAEFLEALADALQTPIATGPGIGRGVVEDVPGGVRFFIPKLVTRGDVVRIDGYLGFAKPRPDSAGTAESIDLGGAWATNILNLPWLIDVAYFSRGDAAAGARRFAPELRRTFDFLPANFEETATSAAATGSNPWEDDPRGWLLARLRRLP